MPNWCQNVVEFTHLDKNLIDGLESELSKGTKDTQPEIFKHLRPYEGEWDYGWCCENWGTKWECNVWDWERLTDNTISVNYDTAWGPPIALYDFLQENGWDVTAYYNEEGMAFAGLYEDGYNDEYEYSNMSSDEIEDNIPEKIDQMFGISSNRRDWEDEQEDDDGFSLEETDQEELREDLDKWLKESLDSLGEEVKKSDKEK